MGFNICHSTKQNVEDRINFDQVLRLKKNQSTGKRPRLISDEYTIQKRISITDEEQDYKSQLMVEEQKPTVETNDSSSKSLNATDTENKSKMNGSNIFQITSSISQTYNYNDLSPTTIKSEPQLKNLEQSRRFWEEHMEKFMFSLHYPTQKHYYTQGEKNYDSNFDEKFYLPPDDHPEQSHAYNQDRTACIILAYEYFVRQQDEDNNQFDEDSDEEEQDEQESSIWKKQWLNFLKSKDCYELPTILHPQPNHPFNQGTQSKQNFIKEHFKIEGPQNNMSMYVTYQSYKQGQKNDY